MFFRDAKKIIEPAKGDRRKGKRDLYLEIQLFEKLIEMRRLKKISRSRIFVSSILKEEVKSKACSIELMIRKI